MSHHIIKFGSICENCNGTGIYKGMGERDGFGVVCYSCKGTGKYHRKIEYDDFVEKLRRTDIVRVIKTNPGIYVGTNEEFNIESFGGMPYSDWFEGKPFPPKSEMRQFSCPAWWYQKENNNKKPKWDECIGIGMFSRCSHFSEKEKCWERFDNEEK